MTEISIDAVASTLVVYAVLLEVASSVVTSVDVETTKVVSGIVNEVIVLSAVVASTDVKPVVKIALTSSVIASVVK